MNHPRFQAGKQEHSAGSLWYGGENVLQVRVCSHRLLHKL